VNTTTIAPPSKWLLPLEFRTFGELAAFGTSLPLLRAISPAGDGHPVIVYPGLGADNLSTLALRRFLKRRGYAVSGWTVGRNYGPRRGVEHSLREQLHEVHRTHGRKVSLIGWSLGGIYARQLAKAMPDAVRSVITLGTPFNGSPQSTNAWRLFELASGKRADSVHRFLNQPVEGAPPVPTTSIYSRTDGVCAWQVCREDPAPNRESIEVQGSHTGLGHHPAVVFAIADRLAQKEGEWQPFVRSGLRALFFPRT
jgi:hypothetical protein